MRTFLILDQALNAGAPDPAEALLSRRPTNLANVSRRFYRRGGTKPPLERLKDDSLGQAPWKPING